MRHCLLFAFQLKKSAIEAIGLRLEENDVSYKTYKKWYQRFKVRNFNLEDDDRSDASRKFDDDELEELLNPTKIQPKRKKNW